MLVRTYVDQFDFLSGNEIQGELDVLQLLGAHPGLLIETFHFLLREDFQEGDEPQSVA